MTGRMDSDSRLAGMKLCHRNRKSTHEQQENDRPRRCLRRPRPRVPGICTFQGAEGPRDTRWSSRPGSTGARRSRPKGSGSSAPRDTQVFPPPRPGERPRGDRSRRRRGVGADAGGVAARRRRQRHPDAGTEPGGGADWFAARDPGPARLSRPRSGYAVLLLRLDAAANADRGGGMEGGAAAAGARSADRPRRHERFEGAARAAGAGALPRGDQRRAGPGGDPPPARVSAPVAGRTCGSAGR